jgi:predicted PurR-regulated permease PerM
VVAVFTSAAIRNGSCCSGSCSYRIGGYPQRQLLQQWLQLLRRRLFATAVVAAVVAVIASAVVAFFASAIQQSTIIKYMDLRQLLLRWWLQFLRQRLSSNQPS